jgi:hypothetical protein
MVVTHDNNAWVYSERRLLVIPGKKEHGGSSSGAERLKRKSFLTMVRQWSERGVPPELTTE